VARLIGLDVGSKRIGYAISDELGIIASPVGVIRRASYNRDAAAIGAIIDASEAERVVVGLPIGLSGADSQQTARVRQFAGMLSTRLAVPVDFWDERFTTAMALRMVGRERRDEGAAALILQGYLDSHRASPETWGAGDAGLAPSPQPSPPVGERGSH